MRTQRLNYRTAPNPAVTPWFKIESYCRGVGDPDC